MPPVSSCYICDNPNDSEPLNSVLIGIDVCKVKYIRCSSAERKAIEHDRHVKRTWSAGN